MTDLGDPPWGVLGEVRRVLQDVDLFLVHVRLAPVLAVGRRTAARRLYRGEGETNRASEIPIPNTPREIGLQTTWRVQGVTQIRLLNR